CRLCLQEPGDPEKLGEFLQKHNLSVHYFCLILSSKLPQRGQSNRGFHGFLPEDIKKEAARASRKICFVCKKKGAAINCQKDQCVRNFHLPCGQERGCLSQFFGEYKSFCEKHRPTQDIRWENVGEESCVLCCEDLSQASVENIQSPCCSQTIYHRKCIQKYAHTSAKHFFKCPHCNNREEFPQEMLRMGIHIPDRDAAWELEPGAFSELYQRYQHCDAPICVYEQGRDSFEDEGLGRKAAREGHKDLRLGERQRVEFASPTFLSPQTAHLKTQVTSPVAAAPSTRGHFCRDSSLEQNPGPSWTDWPGSSSLEKPESSGCRMRAHSW
ncbi:hypothetical protein E2I00_005870, partial [Balaenoptera physalus]